MKILVSKCLLGENCRYKGDNCKNDKVLALGEKYEIVGVCPEVMGGLPTPRQPGEIVGDRVIAKDGADITAEYVRGGERKRRGVLRVEIQEPVLRKGRRV